MGPDTRNVTERRSGVWSNLRGSAVRMGSLSLLRQCLTSWHQAHVVLGVTRLLWRQNVSVLHSWFIAFHCFLNFRSKWADSSLYQATDGEDAHSQTGMHSCCLRPHYVHVGFYWGSAVCAFALFLYLVVNKWSPPPPLSNANKCTVAISNGSITLCVFSWG